MKTLVVNADDFGISPGINRGIIECYRQGIVRSTSLMANLPAFDDAVTLALSEPGLGVGVHLNLTCGKPLTGSENFEPLPRLMKKLLTGQVKLSEIRRELAAQIEKVKKSGLKPSHLDTHQHLHFYPAIQKIVQELAASFQIPWVRGSRRSLLRGIPWQRSFWTTPGSYPSLGKITLLSSLRHLWPQKSAAVKEVHQLSGLFTPAPDAYLSCLDLSLHSLKEGVTEFICHPGYVDAELENWDSWTQMREVELRALLSPLIREKIHTHSITLSNFKEAA